MRRSGEAINQSNPLVALGLPQRQFQEIEEGNFQIANERTVGSEGECD